MASNFANNVRHVQSGEAVSAGVTSRPTKDLEQRTNYLRESLFAIEEGRLLLWKGQRVAAEVLEGNAVYWDAANQQYDRALAAVEVDPASGTLVPKASCDCTGICHHKTSGTMADIAVAGVAWFADLTAMTPSPATPGRYYLSAQEPGQLTLQKPAITVPVCIILGPLDACDQNSWVYIMPQLRDFLGDHTHYRFDLVCRPAGRHAPPAPGEAHVITDADATEQGWLPADDASFNGHAPTGAKFGYNLARHQQLSRVWPPLPLQSATLFWDRAHEYTGATEIPSQGHHRVVTCDIYGIWWMSDCYGDVPWPTNYDNTGSDTMPDSLSSESVDDFDCPRDEDMRVILSFLHMLFMNAQTTVTSLQPGADQPISFRNCDGNAATTGDLWAFLNLAALVDSGEYAGGRAFKQLVGTELTFGLGWMAEGLTSASEYVILSGSHQRLLDPDEPAGVDNPTVHQGIVQVDVNLDPAERELPPQIVRLGDAMERLYQNVPYIGFPNLRDSGIRMRMNVPSAGLPDNPQMCVRTMLFGRASGELPTLTMTYQRLARPTVGSPTVVAEGDTAVTFSVGGVAVVADEAIEIESATFPVVAGDTVLVSIERAADGGYDTAEVGIIRATGIVTGG